MMNDVSILRGLAWEYLKVAKSERNIDNRKLHRAVNDLKMVRPVVLIDEIPWHEMNIRDELTLLCEDDYLRGLEWFFRTTIYRHKHFPADRVIKDYISVPKSIHTTDIGINVKDNVLSTNPKNNIVSHEYIDQLANEEDLEKLHAPVITYNEEETKRRYHLIGEIVGDIIPVKITGIPYVTVVTWDNITRYRGVNNLLMDLIDRPEFMHKLVSKLTDIELAKIEQYEQLDLFDKDPINLHCTPIDCSDLPSQEFDGVRKMTRKDVWGRGAAQIFSSVSKEMHEEFDIEYMKKTIGQCGLVYYGCCEPLDKKIDIVEKIPNLRKVSITPWANVDIAAEAIGKKYVLACKPNPAFVASSYIDREAVKKEVLKILNACKRHGCSFDLVLKDISSCGGRPENIFEWENIVMDLVRNY